MWLEPGLVMEVVRVGGFCTNLRVRCVGFLDRLDVRVRGKSREYFHSLSLFLLGKLPSIKTGGVYRLDRFWGENLKLNFEYSEFNMFTEIKSTQ